MLGIAAGSHNTVIGVKKGPAVDIILSITSKRASPAIVVFTNKQRFYGDQAHELQKSFINTAISYPARLLGFQPDWDGFDEEAKYSLCKPKIDSLTNRTVYEIEYKGKQYTIYPEWAYGLYLNKIKNLFADVRDNKEVTISVPDYFTVNERQAMMDALKVADLKLIQLVNESSANALNYGLFRKKQFDDKPRIVAFVDVGHSKTSIFYGSFTTNNNKVISVTNDRHLGSRDMDYHVVEYYADIFKKKYGCNPMKNGKCILRMVDVVSKARKMLTGNKETSISIESWMEDEDLFANLKREEFEKIIEPTTDRLRNLLIKSLFDAKLKIEEIHSVEMVGDAVRIPIVQQVISEVFNKEVSKTLAPDESIARGSTIFAALTNPSFRIENYHFEHYNNFTIMLEYPFLKDGQVQIRTHKILNKGEHFPTKKSIKFTEKQVPNEKMLNLKLLYVYDELPHMKNHVINSYEIHLPPVNQEKFDFVLHFSMDINGMPFIDKVNITEYWFEEVAVEVKKDDKNNEKKEDGKMEVEQETKKVRKENINPCIINIIEQNYGLSRNILDNLISIEQFQEKEDQELSLVHSKRNEIEQFIYKTRDKLEHDLNDYVLKDELPILVEEMDMITKWFYSEDPLIEDMKTLSEKTQKLNSVGQVIYKRYYDWENLSTAFTQINLVFRNNENQIKVDFEKFTKNDPTVYLQEQDFQELNKVFELYKDKTKEAYKSLEGVPKTSSPPVTDKTIIQYIEDMNKKMNSFYISAETRFHEAKRKAEKEKKEKEEQAKKEKDEQNKKESEAKGQEQKPQTSGNEGNQQQQGQNQNQGQNPSGGMEVD